MCLISKVQRMDRVDRLELERVVAAAQRRDANAFATLMKAHYHLVYGLAYSTAGNWTAAQDIAQDTFVVAWTHIGNLRGAGAFPMWIRKIARNLALNWVRSADYRRRLADRHAQLSPTRIDESFSAPDALEREDRRAALWNAMQQLNAPIREALVLFYLEGRSVSEAARQLGISENAFKLRLHTGRTRLRAIFEKQIEERLDRDLAPPDSSTAASRIMAALALGPVMPHLGDAGASSTLGLWLDHFLHNASIDALGPILKGGALVSSKKAVMAVAATVLCLGGAYWGFVRQPNFDADQGENWRRVAKEESGRATPNPDLDSRTSSSAVDTAKTSELSSTAETVAEVKPANELDNLEISGDTSPSAAIVMTFETGKIKDPAQYVSISGSVVDTHGSGVPNASVLVFALGDNTAPGDMTGFLAARQSPAHQFSAVTDATGRFLVEGIMFEGAAMVSASADGYAMEGRRQVHVPIRAGDKVANVRITLEQGKGLYGKLLAPDGKPVADGVVNLVAFKSTSDSSNGNMGTINTDTNGRFHFAFPREGLAYLVTSSLKFGGASFDDVPVGTDDIIELQMPKAARLTGAISRADGGPAEDVLVLLIGKANDGTGRRRVDASSIYAGKTDSSGRYAIEAIDTNQAYTVSVARQDRTPLSQPEPLPELAPGESQTWNYTIQDIITVRGHVVGETTGLPLRNVKVAALKDGKPVQNGDTPVDMNGAYEMKLTSGPGNYTIFPRLWRIDAEETGYDWGKQIVLEPAQEATVDLTFIDTATISIRVVDTSGQPIRGMVLGIKEADHTWAPVATTPDDGRFTYGGVMPGIESNFVVFDSGNRVGSTTPVIAEPGQVFPEETVVVYGNAGIEGTALGPDGQPLANGVINLRVFYALTRQLERSINTDSSGHFLIESGLPATAVILAMEGVVDGAGGEERFLYESDELLLIDGNILNLGNLTFVKSDSSADANVEENLNFIE